ncbi:uncharacterized protein [Physcomitrium patens]|uniref:uncharacterized protein isoform X2 n=1 Tax=Physcomitrium patens TaxID=3218 RepID=UPI003CCDFE61
MFKKAVLVAIYEENEKPPIALEYVRHALGGPTISEHEMSKNKVAELEAKYDLLLKQHEEACRQLQLLQPRRAEGNCDGQLSGVPPSSSPA